MSERANTSVLLLTLNEETNLPRCLEALSWCDDIVVLDSFSNDGTLAIAQASGARIVQRSFDNFAMQRNFAQENIQFRHDWILHLDADEVVTPELVAAIRRTMESSALDAYRIPSKTMFRGRWLRFSGMYPTYQVRLTRLGAFSFRQVGHGQKEDIHPDRIGTINEPYLHFAFSRGLDEWFEKHNRYSRAEALDGVAIRSSIRWLDLFTGDSYRRRQALRSLSQRLPFRPLLRFLYMFVIRGGFLEGREGLSYCLLLATYELMITEKTCEARRRAAGLEL